MEQELEDQGFGTINYGRKSKEKTEGAESWDKL
jgi:hypothetical protein